MKYTIDLFMRELGPRDGFLMQIQYRDGNLAIEADLFQRIKTYNMHSLFIDGKMYAYEESEKIADGHWQYTLDEEEFSKLLTNLGKGKKMVVCEAPDDIDYLFSNRLKITCEDLLNAFKLLK